MTILPSSNEKGSLASTIRANAAKKIQDELGLIPFGSGAQMMYQIAKLKLVFQCRHLIDVDEGRSLLLQASNIFLNEINIIDDGIVRYDINNEFSRLATIQTETYAEASQKMGVSLNR